MTNKTLALIGAATMLTLSACVTRVPLDPLPKGEEVFKLAPEQLLKDYPLIEGLAIYPQATPPPIYDRFLTLEEISKEWGPAAKNEINWGFEGRRYSLVGIGIQLESPQITGLIAGIVTALSPRPPRDFTWEKGDYQVTGTFDRILFSQPRLIAWNWQHKDTNLTYQDIAPGVRETHAL